MSIQATGNDLVVIADNPQELVESQKALISSVTAKISLAKEDLKEAQEILAAAKMAAIDDSAAKRLVKKEEHRLMYLEKSKAALEAGYVMLPNIPGQIIAIRVQRKYPNQGNQYSKKYLPTPEIEPPDALAAGEGRYVQPVPPVTYYENRDAAGVVTRDMIRGGFENELALPAQFLKPTVIERTAKAIKLKVFDEIVAVYDGASEASSGSRSTRVGDPLILGRVIDGASGMKREKRRRVLSFLIAWFVDTRAI